MHALGHADAQCLWVAEAVLPVGEGYAKSYRELMEETDWDSYGTGRYEKCANCMAHCGYEPTAAMDALAHPMKALMVGLRGPKCDRPDGAGDRPLPQRKADYGMHERHVAEVLAEIHAPIRREAAE